MPDLHQKTLQHLLDMRESTRSNLLMNESVADTVKRVLESISSPTVSLKVNDIRVVEKHDNDNIADQKDVKNKGRVWSNDLKADLELIDPITGKTIDRVDGIKVATIPKVTDRSTYIVGGNEYQFTKQSRLKPGIYTKTQNNGDISSFFNVDKTVDFERGFNNNFKINFDPERKIFTMQYGSKNVPLLSALKAAGVPRSDVVSKWGKDVYDANARAYDKHEVRDQVKLYSAVFGKLPPKDITHQQLKSDITTRLFATKLDPQVNKITLGKPYSQVNGDAILDASKKIIDIHKGDAEDDDRESLIFKSFHDVEDHVRERIIKNADKIVGSIKYRLDKTKKINKSISSQVFDPFIVGTITTSQLSNPPNQTNLMSIIGENKKITVVGEGGIGNANAITNDVRQISNSEAGFIDPLHTPEGSNIGVAVHAGINTIKIGNDLYSKFRTMNGEKVMLRPIDVYDKHVAFPDQFDMSGKRPQAKNKTVKAIYKGKLVEVPSSKIDAVISNASNLFDTSVNMIPFLDSIQGNRGLTASKMQEQALPLVNRDAPLFRIRNEDGKDVGAVIAESMALPKSKINGTIKSVDADKIVVVDGKGNESVHHLYNNFSLNSESFIHNEPVVKPGDKVSEGQVLADNNFTKGGHFATGANLRVAYVPYKGYNYEDSTIVSESAAKKLTSVHMYDLKAKRSAKGVFSREKFRAYYPEEMKAKQAAKLDKDGVIKPGERVEMGDVVIAHLERKAPTADDIAIGRLDKQLKRDMANNAVKWENDHVGVVTGVEKHGNSVVVNIKTEEPLKVADKIAGLHGNKHIVSKIVPDEEMPYVASTGARVDITMNPIGVSNRINTSQLLEAAAGKIAEKTGKPYEIQNFSPTDNTRRVIKDLEVAGVSDKDELVDPETGKPMLNPVMTGIAHIMKLEHKVDHKFNARYREGYDSNEQPATGGKTGSKNLGRMEMAALLARGANENLREMFNIKGQRNDEYWRAMETGQSLPPPKRTFVWDKMLAMMHGSGINVEQKGKTFGLKPMTDADIDELSAGALSDPTMTYRKKDLQPIKGGLFDPVKAGGLRGDNYTHFDLPEKVLNPSMLAAASSILGMPATGLEDIINGKKFVDLKTSTVVEPGTPGAVSGGPAVEHLLKTVDVDGDLKNLQDMAKTTTNATLLNKYHKRIRYLKALKESNSKPTDYMISKVLVVPSKYRPMVTMGTDNVVIMSDVNYLYQQAGMTVSALKDLKTSLKETGADKDTANLRLAEIRGAMYNDVKAVAGLREPTAFLHRKKNKKGFIAQIDGGETKQTKEGFFQDRVMERKQDLVGRSTIILDPNLGGDEIGIPKDMATQMFKPFIMKKMVSWGYSPLEAQKHIKDETPIFNRAREVVADERLVIANRAPTLHRWNMTAFKPKLTNGKSIEVPSVVVSKNFGGDFDGDSALSTVVILVNINELQQEIKQSKKIRFDSDFYIDIDRNIDYITSILKPMEVVMPSVEKLLVNSEMVVHVHISQFPRIEETKRVKENGNEEYDVPDGISIFTIDNTTHEFKKIPVKTFSIHKNLPNYTIETSSGDYLLLSHDQSAVAINRSTWEIEKVTPEDLKHDRLIPKIRNIDIEESVFEISLIDHSISDGPSHKPTNHCKKSIRLDNDFGWLIGAMIGDGWVSNTNGQNQLCLSAMDENVGNKFCRIVNTMLDRDAKPTITDNTHEFKGYQCFSKKYSITTSALTNNFVPWIGKGAYNKHLPQFYMSAPREFREGLLAGLLDTDGAVCWLKKKNGRQFNIQYSSMSEVLIDEIVSLCRSLGISASISFGNERPNGIERRAVLSTNTVHGKKLSIVHKDKSAALAEFYSEPLKDSSVSARQDLVPFSPEVFMIAKEFVHHVRDKSLYGNINDSKRCAWRISRQSAKRLIDLDVDHKLPKKWVDIVNNENVTWVYAKSVRLNNQRVDMYDITAPGPYTFMLSNGIIVQDTFQLHTPISAKALREAESMKPSASMFKVGYDTVLNSPSMDMTVGAWLVSKGKGGSDKVEKFDSLDSARIAFSNNKITYADKVDIGGIKAPFGIHEINAVVPEDSRNYDIELTSKNIDNWIGGVTKAHNGKLGLGLADTIKRVGSNYVTKFGFTIGLSDTKADTDIRDSVIGEADKPSNKKDPDSIIKAYKAAVAKGQQMLKDKHGDQTMLGIGIASGGSKGIGNTAAITLMPGIVTDADGKPLPTPITKSYSEGLDTSSYWAAAHGARSGNIMKSVSSQKPGWLTKDLINSVYGVRVVGDEPMDVDGIEYDVSDKRGIVNRYIAEDIKDNGGRIVAKRNDLVTSDVVNKLNKHKISKIKVQSPITDPTPGDGFSPHSYGPDYDGKLPNHGDHIGIMSAHTITEPSVNMAMKAFHTGGAAGAGKNVGSAFEALDRALRMPKNIPNKATLASANGTIKSVSKSSIGGHDIIIDKDGVEEVRYVDPSNEILVKPGDKVLMGDPLSSGIPSAHDVLKYKGMKKAQTFLVNHIDEINDKSLEKRNIETIVRGITNTTRIMDPGSSNFVSGDVAPLTTVNWMNRNNEKEVDIADSVGSHLSVATGRFGSGTKITESVADDLGRHGIKRVKITRNPIVHEPFLTPAGIGAKARVSEDWVARLAHNRIADVLTEGAAQRWKSNIGDLAHPITEFVIGDNAKQ